MSRCEALHPVYGNQCTKEAGHELEVNETWEVRRHSAECQWYPDGVPVAVVPLRRRTGVFEHGPRAWAESGDMR